MIYLNCPLCGFSVKRGELSRWVVGTTHCPRCERRGRYIALVEASQPGRMVEDIPEGSAAEENPRTRFFDLVREVLRSREKRSQ